MEHYQNLFDSIYHNKDNYFKVIHKDGTIFDKVKVTYIDYDRSYHAIIKTEEGDEIHKIAEGDEVVFTEFEVTDESPFYVDPELINELKQISLIDEFRKEFANVSGAYRHYIEYHRSNRKVPVLYVLKDYDSKQRSLGTIIMTIQDRDPVVPLDPEDKPRELYGQVPDIAEYNQSTKATVEAWRYREMPWTEVAAYFPNYVKSLFGDEEP